MNEPYPKQYELWIADLKPSAGSEPGKVRPVVIIQSDALNKTAHGTFVICPISSQKKESVSLLRIYVKATAENGLLKESFILCDQLRSIDSGRLKMKIGVIDKEIIKALTNSIRAILTLY